MILAAGMGCLVFQASAVTWSFIDNGTIKLGVDTSRGACIGWFSPSGGADLLNYYDNGRFMQQSYYGDADGSYWNTTPWNYNPVQGGGWRSEWPSLLLSFSNTGNRIYAKTRPCHWATGAQLPEVVMEEWISLKGSVAHVHYKMTYSGASAVTFRAQEMPAVFVDFGLTDLVFYSGRLPWKNDTLTSVTVPPTSPPVGVAYNRSEHWAAYVHPVHRGGIGVYTPEAVAMTSYRFQSQSGTTGPTGASCSYFAPVRFFTLKSGCSVEYDLFITTGTDTDIRTKFYDVHANGFDADNDGMDDVWEYQKFGSINTAKSTSDYDKDGLKDVDEFRAGSNPKDAQSGFYVQFEPNQSLLWNGDWGRRYQVKQSSSLVSPSWANVYTNYSGNPALNTFAPAQAGSHKFFRINAKRDAAAQLPGWQFNDFSPGIAWRPANMVSLNIVNGVLRGVSNTNTSYIITHTATPMLLDAASYSHLAIRLKNKSTANRIQLLSRRSTETTGWSINIILPISANDTDFKTYDFNLAASTNWYGKINLMVLKLLSVLNNGSYDLDYVMFY